MVNNNNPMFSLVVTLIFTMLCFKFVVLEDTNTSTDEKVSNKTTELVHLVDETLANLSKDLNKQSLSIALSCVGLKSQEKQKSIYKRLKPLTITVVRKVKNKLAQSDSDSLKAVAGHLEPSYLGRLVAAAGGIYPWENHLAEELAIYAINSISEYITEFGIKETLNSAKDIQ